MRRPHILIAETVRHAELAAFADLHWEQHFTPSGARIARNGAGERVRLVDNPAALRGLSPEQTVYLGYGWQKWGHRIDVLLDAHEARGGRILKTDELAADPSFRPPK